MRHILLLLALLFIQSCTENTKGRLQGHWVCVENCDEINTLDFHGDSVEINRYLKFLRLKNKSLYHITENVGTLIFENSFEKRNIDYEIENDFLILKVNGDITFKKMKYDEKAEIKNFIEFGKIKFSFPSIDENPMEKKQFCKNNPIPIIFTEYKNKPALYKEGIYVPLKNVKNAIIPTHFSEEEAVSNQYFLFIDKKLKMKEVVKIFEIIQQAELYKLCLVYKSNKSLFSFPEYYSEYVFPQPFDFNKTIHKKRNQFKNLIFKDSVINNYFNHMDEKTEITVSLNQDKIFINGVPCKNLDQFKKELRLLLKHEENVSNSIKIDSAFITMMDDFIQQNQSTYPENEIESLQKDWEAKEEVLNFTKEYLTTNYQSIIVLESDPEVEYNHWIQAFVIIKEIHSELRAEICDKYFNTNFYKLNENILEDQEIIKMVRGILPMRFIPYLIKNKSSTTPSTAPTTTTTTAS